MHKDLPIRTIKPKLIGVYGFKHAGKDTIGAHLAQAYGFERRWFATRLKHGLAVMFNVPIELFYDPALKDTPDERLKGRTPRYLMETLGTNWGRETVDEDLWEWIVEQEIVQLRRSGHNNIAILDVRMDSEARLIKRMGGTIWEVRRPSAKKGTARSESGISPELVDEVIYNNIEYAPGADFTLLYAQVGVAIAHIDKGL